MQGLFIVSKRHFLFEKDHNILQPMSAAVTGLKILWRTLIVHDTGIIFGSLPPSVVDRLKSKICITYTHHLHLKTVCLID